jgi:hypothetical protein
MTLERLKREVMALRYKARRYDEIKEDVPRWRAKAARYDKLAGRKEGRRFGSWRRGSQVAAIDGDDVKH